MILVTLKHQNWVEQLSGSEKQAKNLVIDFIKRFHVGFTRSKKYVFTEKSKKALVSTLFLSNLLSIDTQI